MPQGPRKRVVDCSRRRFPRCRQVTNFRPEETSMQEWVLWFLILFWSGPIGLGIFLAGLGVYYWGKSLDRKSRSVGDE